jgi:hypothetical protein
MNALDLVTGSPALGTPVLVSWIPYEKLDRALHRIVSDAYCKARYLAKKRGLGWHFTLISWWTYWAQSGLWSKRGHGMGKYQMCRLGPDKGDYAPHNVKIATHEENVRERSPEVHMAGVRRRTRRKSWRTNVVAAIHGRFAEKRRRAQEASP